MNSGLMMDDDFMKKGQKQDLTSLASGTVANGNASGGRNKQNLPIFVSLTYSALQS